MGIVLRCTHGARTGETITIESELMLGREEPEPGHLPGDPRVSRRHARLFVDADGRAFAEDLGSSNGTFVNEQRLTGPHAIETGDVLRVGQTTFEIDVPVSPAATQLDTVTPQASATVADAPPPQPRLVVISGPKQGEEIPLDHEFLIGRGYGEPGALGGDRRLSRKHARIAAGPGGVFFIEDTGSSNGTTLNGAQLRRVHSLKDGDQIGVGSSTLEPHGFPRVPLELELELGEQEAVAQPAPAAPVHPPPPPPAVAIPPPEPPPPPLPPPAAVPAAAPAGHYVPQGAAHTRLSHRHGRLVGIFIGVFALAAAVAVAVVVLVKPLGTRACPSGFVCQQPLTAPPLHALTTFTGALGWRVEYDTQSAVPATANAAGNELALHESSSYDQHVLGNTGSPIIAILIRGYRSSEVSPNAAIKKLAGTIESQLVGTVTAPSSDQLFGRPVLGFHPAIGEVLEGNAQTPQGPGPLVKLAIVSAAAGGVTVGLAVIYPVQRGQSQGDNPDRALDVFGDQILGTVRFPSDGAT
ncbi:MAG TPA: FHA domain-containing protein [Solirubrobacteraceae bacterium]|nr:FHA domain-containing protein [Solirubrobacteraceae bacterium]